MVLADTNVIASLMLEGPFTQRARALRALDADWRSEAFVLVELTSVFATQVRAKRLTLDKALASLHAGTEFIEPGLMLVSHAAALRLSVGRGASAYDARFLAAAQALGQPLVTEDRRLRALAPDLTSSLDDALAR